MLMDIALFMEYLIFFTWIQFIFVRSSIVY